MTPPPHPLALLSVKELGQSLGRSRSYVYAMRQRGFRLIGGRATISAAIVFLEKNPKPMRKI